MNPGRPVEKLTYRSRERERSFAGANDQHFGDYTDEPTVARSQLGLYGGGGAPPGSVNECDEGRPNK